MRGRILPMMLVVAVGLTGCLSISRRGTSAPPMMPPPMVQPPMAQRAAQPAKPPSSPPPEAPAPAAITGSKLTATLSSSQANKAQLYLFAPDEKVQIANASSCIAQAGDTLRTGKYGFYLLPAGATGPVAQNLSLPGGEGLEFNDQQPKYLTILPGEPGRAPDLLLLQQYASCNGTFAFALALSQDGAQLIPYNFVAKRTSLTTGISSMEQLGPGKLRTTVYNNATGIYTTTTWEVREAEQALVATSVDEIKHKAARCMTAASRQLHLRRLRPASCMRNATPCLPLAS